MPKKILIVEDHEDSREMTKILVSFFGYEVFEAVNGSEAIEKSIKFCPDLILMDLAMPVVDGIATTKTIRAIKGLDKIPIVALTGFGNTSFEKAVETGFNGVLTKPLQFEKLEPLLNYYLA